MFLPLLLTLSSTFLNDLYNEMSMDTYQYGSDPTPMIVMKNGLKPVIDSIGDSCLYGHFNVRQIIWDENGQSNLSVRKYDLIFTRNFRKNRN